MTVSVEGQGNLVAFDNGSITDHTPFASPQRRAENGKALVILRGSGKAGRISVPATAPGLRPATASMAAR